MDADHTLAEAVRQCGATAAARIGHASTAQATVAMRLCEAGVRCVPLADRVGPLTGTVAQAFLRVDLQAWARKDGTPDPAQVDAFIRTQEPALGVLVAPWAGYPAPFHGMRLAVVRGPDGLHLATSKNGRWRESRWIVREQ